MVSGVGVKESVGDFYVACSQEHLDNARDFEGRRDYKSAVDELRRAGDILSKGYNSNPKILGNPKVGRSVGLIYAALRDLRREESHSGEVFSGAEGCFKYFKGTSLVDDWGKQYEKGLVEKVAMIGTFALGLFALVFFLSPNLVGNVIFGVEGVSGELTIGIIIFVLAVILFLVFWLLKRKSRALDKKIKNKSKKSKSKKK